VSEIAVAPPQLETEVIDDAVKVPDSTEDVEVDLEAAQLHPADTPVLRKFNVKTHVRAGGALLALCAGIVNSVAFLALGAFVSHATGTLTKAGLYIEDPSGMDAFALLGAFVFGSTICGMLIAHDSIHFGLGLYDICLITNSGLLVATTFLADHKEARYLAAAACGLQNGMATHWGGAVIRTTHVTGLFTDVGLLTGRLISMMLRKGCGKRFDDIDRALFADDVSKLSVLWSIASAFLVGCIVGTKLHSEIEEYAFLIPAAITGTAGVTYMIYRVVVLHEKFFSDAEMEIIDVPADIIAAHVHDAEGAAPEKAASGMAPEKKASGVSAVSGVSFQFPPSRGVSGVSGGSQTVVAGRDSPEIVSVRRSWVLRNGVVR
jgi:uncharacterized membrane protein YoaK (UPF0700 family)